MKIHLMFTFLLIFILTGCNSEVVSVSAPIEADTKTTSTVESEEARENLKSQIEEFLSYLESKVEEIGYLTPEEFNELKDRANLIAISIESDGVIEYNDDKHINKMLNVLLEETINANDTVIITAESEINSSDNIYVTNFKEHINSLMHFIDLNGEYNRLDQFISIYNGDESSNEIKEKTKWYIEEIEKFEYKSILTLEDKVKTHEESFSENELYQLNSLLSSLKKSINIQIDIFNEIGSVTFESDTSLTEKINQADKEYLNAKNELDSLELELGIGY